MPLFDHEAGMKNAAGTLKEGVRGLSKGLMGSAFESFGKAFGGGGYTPRGQKPDQGHMQNWRAMGAQTQKALENRWHMAEFQTFRKNELAAYEGGLKELLDRKLDLVQQLNEGRWPNENVEGGYETYDLNNEKDRMKILRLKSTLEAETFRSVMDMQIGLNNKAAEKYYSNPIVGEMIQNMMMKQNEMLQGQFNMGAQSRKQAGGELDLQNTQADIRGKNAQSSVLEASAAKKGAQYNSITEAQKDMTAGEFVDFATNHPTGRALLQDSVYGDYLEQSVQRRRAQFRADKGWTDEDAQNGENPALEAEFMAAEMPRLKQRTLGEFIEGEFGEEAFAAAAAAKKGVGRDKDGPTKFAVEVMPPKEHVEELEKDWNTLGTELANLKMRKDPSLTKPEAIDWLMDEWFDEAMKGNDIATGGPIPQLAGMTADADNAAVKPYIEKIRKSLEKYAKQYVGTGAGTEQLLEHQKGKRPSGSRGARRNRAFGRAAATVLDKVTPDAILPNIGKGLYPEQFKKRHPDER